MERPDLDIWRILRDAIYILLGSISLALGLVFFLIPNKIATGGIAGLSIVLHYLVGFPTGSIMLTLNIPVLIVGLRYLGRQFLLRSLLAIVAVSFFTDFFVINLHFPALTDTLLLATLYGGLLVGVGLGLIFKGEASAGGGTVVARIVSRKSRFKTGQVLFVIDLVVITSAAITFQNIELALWGFITIFISSQLVDLILTGKPFAKVILIVTKHTEDIGLHIIRDLERSATIIDARGLYSGEPKDMMVVVVDSSQIAKLRDIVHLHDKSAFMVVIDAKEILGQGF